MVMIAPAMGGKERNPEKPPRKKMKDDFPVTLKSLAVQEIPLANWKAIANPMMTTPVYREILW